MAGDLEQLGVEFLAKGVQSFISDLNSAITAQGRLRDSLGQFTTAEKLAAQAIPGMVAALKTKIASIEEEMAALRKSVVQHNAYNTSVEQSVKGLDRANQARITSERNAVNTQIRENARAIADQEKFATAVEKLLQQESDARTKAAQAAQRDFDAAKIRQQDILNKDAMANLIGQAGKPVAIDGKSTATPEANTQGLSYLRTLTSLNAATQLLGVSSTATLQNIATLGLAFGQLGKGAGIAAAGIGVFLAGVGSVVSGIEQIKAFVVGLIINLERLAIALGAVVAAATGVSIKLGSDYAASLNKASVFTGATADELVRLDKSIEAVSRRSGQDMPMLANTISDLGKAGFTTGEILSGNMLKAVTDLTIASSGDLGLADAADVTAKTLRAFSLDSTHTAEVVNALAGVAQSSVVKFSDLAVAMKYASPIAAALGFTVQDTAAAIGVLGNAGIVGSTAGTNLRQMFVSLEKPTKNAAEIMNKYGISLYDSAGRARPFRDILIGLQTAFGDAAISSGKLTQEERNRALVELFTVRGAQAALTLVRQQIGAYDELRLASEKLTASNLATALLTPLNVQWEILINNIKVSATQFGEGFLPLLQMGVTSALGFVSGLEKINFGIVGLAVQAVVLGKGFNDLGERLKELKLPPTLGAGIAEFLNLLLSIRQAIVNQIIPAIQDAWERLNLFGDFTTKDMITEFRDLSTGIRIVGEVAAYAIVGFADFVNNVRQSPEAIVFLKNALVGLAIVFVGLPTVVIAVSIAVLSAITTMVELIIIAVMKFSEIIAEVWTSTWNGALLVIQSFVKGVLASIPVLGPVFSALANAPDEVKTAWAGGFNNLLRIVVDFANSVISAIRGMTSSPLFQALANLPGSPLSAFAGGGGLPDGNYDPTAPRGPALATNDPNSPFFGYSAGGSVSAGPISAGGGGSRVGDIFGQLGGIPDVLNTIITRAPQAANSLDFAAGSLSTFMDNIVKDTPAVDKALKEVLDDLENTGASTAPGRGSSGGGGGAGGKGPKQTGSALDAFLADAENYKTQFGKLGADLANKLSDGIQEGTTGAHADVRGALNTLVAKLKDEGVGDWQYLGEALEGALETALREKTPEAENAARALILGITQALDENIIEDKFNKIVAASQKSLLLGFLKASAEMQAAVVKADEDVATAIQKSTAAKAISDQKDTFNDNISEIKNAFAKLGSDTPEQLGVASDAIKARVDTMIANISDFRSGFNEQINGLNSDLGAASIELKNKVDTIVNLFKMQADNNTQFNDTERTIKGAEALDKIEIDHRRKLQDISRSDKTSEQKSKDRKEEEKDYQRKLADLKTSTKIADDAAARKDDHDKAQAQFKANENTAIADFNRTLKNELDNFTRQEKLNEQIAAIYEKLNTETLPAIAVKFDELAKAEKIRFDEAIEKLPMEQLAADTVYDGMRSDLEASLSTLRKLIALSNAAPGGGASNAAPRGEVNDVGNHNATESDSSEGGYPSGGVVGHTHRAIVHAGEAIIANTQWQQTIDSMAMVAKALTAITMKEVTGAGMGGNTINQYSYNVAASYSQQQSPASVGMDIKAMIAMAQR